jgi:putative ABC transport system permease protein
MGGAKLALPFMAESKNAHLILEGWIAGGSIGLALLLGLSASLYPALHASKMDPTEALRAL